METDFQVGGPHHICPRSVRFLHISLFIGLTALSDSTLHPPLALAHLSAQTLGGFYKEEECE